MIEGSRSGSGAISLTCGSGSGQEAQKHTDPPDPGPQHCFIHTLFLFYSPKFNFFLPRIFYKPHGRDPAGSVPAGVCQGPLPGGAAGGVARARAASGPAAGGDRGPLLLAAAHAHGQAAGQGARRRIHSAWYIHYTTIFVVLRIRDILVRIRIRGSEPLTNGFPDQDPGIFVSDLQDDN